MFFYVLLSTVAILTGIIGCAVIWGYDVKRARGIERSTDRTSGPALPTAAPAAEVTPGPAS